MPPRQKLQTKFSRSTTHAEPTKHTAKLHHEIRTLKNRIFELEQAAQARKDAVDDFVTAFQRLLAAGKGPT